jgi:hypothetical protein
VRRRSAIKESQIVIERLENGGTNNAELTLFKQLIEDLSSTCEDGAAYEGCWNNVAIDEFKEWVT